MLLLVENCTLERLPGSRGGAYLHIREGKMPRIQKPERLTPDLANNWHGSERLLESQAMIV